ncbi:MAG: alpha/beta hydrolase [Bacteroidota bacterium]
MLYLIPGLGADARVFSYLDLGDQSHQVIQWEIPHKNEPLASYVDRLLPQIQRESAIDLIGVSFGGIIALEIAKRLPCRRLMLISSLLHSRELPLLTRLLGRITNRSWIPDSWIRQSMNIGANYLFGPLDSEERVLLKRILDDTDIAFVNWATSHILKWEGAEQKDWGTRLHGTKDRIIPISKVPTCVMIRGGGHMMIVSHAKEISDWIRGDWIK